MATASGGSPCVDSDIEVPEYENVEKEESNKKQPFSKCDDAPTAEKSWYCDKEVSKQEDALENVFDEVKELLDMEEFAEDLRHKVFEIYPDFKTVLDKRLLDLKRRDCGIVVAGDTSCGKSTLVNLMLGDTVSPSDLFQTTSKIIKMRGSDRLGIQVFDESLDMVAKHTSLKSVEHLRKLMITLSSECYSSDSDSEDVDRNSAYEIKDENWDVEKACLGREIEIFFPSSLLKGNIMLVDTPGCGNSIHGNFKSLLFEYLPNAVSFIFVLDVNRAGGLENDRMVELFAYLQNNEDMLSFEARDAIFVLNKIDSIRPQTEKYIEKCTRKIKENITTIWPDVQLDHIFCMSTGEIKVGGEKYPEEYRKFEKVLQEIIQRNENKRMKIHLSFLAQLVKSIQLIIEPRYQQSETSVEEKRVFVQGEMKKHERLIKLCKEKQDLYLSKIYIHISHLSKTTFEYMQTEGFMHRILNEGGQQLMTCNRLQVRKKIAEIVEVLSREIIAREVKKINNSELNNSMLKDFKEIHELMHGLQDRVTGLDDADNINRRMPFALKCAFYTIGLTLGAYAIYENPLRLPFVVSAVATFISCNSYIVVNAAKSINIPFERFIQSSIEDMLAGFDIDTVRAMLEETIGDQLRKLNRRIFQEILPGEIKKMKIAIEGLELEQNDLLKRHGDLNKLKRKLTQIVDHTNDCYSLIYKD
ncbi:uncharacterized protein LOC134243751 isoform X2 [Saccostrea cucullata]|uniref:uncharacterized protein LOC134243751 isoform X2 n=1 Tax=Saccostrea cuccullata TaxID=36930 RepID=UPI002ED06802